jgi:hypothetical protein
MLLLMLLNNSVSYSPKNLLRHSVLTRTILRKSPTVEEVMQQTLQYMYVDGLLP